MLVWDNLNTHLTAGMRRYIAERDWLTVYQLSPPTPPTSTPWKASGRYCDAPPRPTAPSPTPTT